MSYDLVVLEFDVFVSSGSLLGMVYTGALLAAQSLLHAPTNRATFREVLANSTVSAQWTTNFLCGTAQRTLGCSTSVPIT